MYWPVFWISSACTAVLCAFIYTLSSLAAFCFFRRCCVLSIIIACRPLISWRRCHRRGVPTHRQCSCRMCHPLWGQRAACHPGTGCGRQCFWSVWLALVLSNFAALSVVHTSPRVMWMPAGSMPVYLSSGSLLSRCWMFCTTTVACLDALFC